MKNTYAILATTILVCAAVPAIATVQPNMGTNVAPQVTTQPNGSTTEVTPKIPAPDNIPATNNIPSANNVPAENTIPSTNKIPAPNKIPQPNRIPSTTTIKPPS
jgi:hypothetical protein